MPRLRSVVVRPEPVHSLGDAVNATCLLFAEVVRAELMAVKTDAPVVKLNILLCHGRDRAEPSFRVYVPFVSGVGTVEISRDFSALSAAASDDVRSEIAAITSRVLDAIASDAGWDSPSLRAIVDGVGRHRGPYRRDLERLTVRDRQTGMRYVTVLELSEGRTELCLECRDEIGSVRGRQSAWKSDHIVTLVDDPAFKRARLQSETIEYQHEDRSVTLTALRPACA